MELKKGDSKKLVLFLHGASADIYNDDRFLKLQDNIEYDFIRGNLWESKEELQNLTLEKIEGTLKEATDTDREVVGIGKSIGGGLLMMFAKYFDKLILWAPAIYKGAEMDKRAKLENYKHLTITNIELPKTLIIHGTKDTKVPLSNSEQIVKETGAELYILKDGHSFRETIDKVIEKTVSFI